MPGPVAVPREGDTITVTGEGGGKLSKLSLA